MSIANLTFAPDEIAISMGNVVRWVNNDSVTHTVTSGEPGHATGGILFDQTLAPGESFCFQVNVTSDSGGSDDDVDYFCRIHPQMLGEIKVSP